MSASKWLLLADRFDSAPHVRTVMRPHTIDRSRGRLATHVAVTPAWRELPADVRVRMLEAAMPVLVTSGCDRCLDELARLHMDASAEASA